MTDSTLAAHDLREVWQNQKVEAIQDVSTEELAQQRGIPVPTQDSDWRNLREYLAAVASLRASSCFGVTICGDSDSIVAACRSSTLVIAGTLYRGSTNSAGEDAAKDAALEDLGWQNGIEFQRRGTGAAARPAARVSGGGTSCRFVPGTGSDRGRPGLIPETTDCGCTPPLFWCFLLGSFCSCLPS